MKINNMTQDERVKYMTTQPIPGLICRMSVPTIISMLVTAFYNMADTFFVGKIDTQSTAAVGVAFSVMALIQAMGFFFGHGSGNYISRQLGAREYEDAARMSATGFFTAILTGIVFGVTGVLFVDKISLWLGSTPTILPYTSSYLEVIFLGTPFMIGSFVLNNQMRFQGNASLAMIGIVSGSLLNIVLDPVLIFAFDMGVAGAAWATIISQFVSFCILLYMNLTKAAIKVSLKRFTPNMHYFSNIFRGGIPSLCRQGIGSISTIVLNTAAGNYGGAMADAAIAAMGVVTRISMFANSALIGFGQGFQPVCGTNYGAGKYTRVREAFYFCIKVGTAALFCISVAGFIFAKPLISVFRDDPAVISIGVVALRAQCLSFTLNAYNIICNMLLQTIGKALRASIVSVARQGLFLIPALLILPVFLGLFGVQIAQMVADVFSFLLAIPMTMGVIKSFKTDRTDAV